MVKILKIEYGFNYVYLSQVGLPCLYAACVTLRNSKKNHLICYIRVLIKCCMLMHKKSFFTKCEVCYKNPWHNEYKYNQMCHMCQSVEQPCCNGPKSSNSCRFVLSTLALLLGVCNWLLQMKCADHICLQYF